MVTVPVVCFPVYLQRSWFSGWFGLGRTSHAYAPHVVQSLPWASAVASLQQKVAQQLEKELQHLEQDGYLSDPEAAIMYVQM